LWVLLAILGVALVAGLVWFLMTHQPEPPRPPPPPPAAAAPEPTAPPPPPPSPDERSGRSQQELLGQISSSSDYQAWIRQPEALSRFAAAVTAISDGHTPKDLLRFLAPSGAFKTYEKGSKLYIDSASYARYDFLAKAFSSLDAAVAARAYEALRPALAHVYAEFGRPGTQFETVLAKALKRISQAPIPEGNVELVPGEGALYAFANPKYEALPAAEKQLLRMGPKNARLIQAKCKELLAALPLAKPQ
jgi:hypothetical protein